MIETLINRPCVITRGSDAPPDDFGLEDPPEPGEEVETVCELQQRNRSEPGEDGEVSSSDWVLFLRADEVLGTADTVEVDGESYEVVGEPWRARNPLTRQFSHVEATVRRVG